MSNEIAIKIDGPNLTPEKFLRASKAFFDLIQGVSRNLSNEDLNWVVEVDAGSAIVRTRSQPLTTNQTIGRPRDVINAVVRGVNSLKSGVQSAPPLFGRDEIVAARTLAAIVDGAAIRSIFLQADDGTNLPGNPEEMSSTIVATADAILDAGSSVAFGSIEGIIDGLSIRDGFKCTVFEPNYRRGINCVFNKKELEADAHKAFGKRVLVSGMLKYNKEGHPYTMHADALRVFPEESELPSLQEIQAIYREIYQ